ncbi:MAG: F0F1 ATP synthase subunit A [Christensenellales bacterium]
METDKTIALQTSQATDESTTQTIQSTQPKQTSKKTNDTLFRIVDILLIIGMILPIVAAMVLKVIFTPASQGVEITGALIYFTIPMPFMDLPIGESQVNSWLLIISIVFLCLFMTHGIKERPNLKRQYVIEWAVDKVKAMVGESMGEYFAGFASFIAGIMVLSAFSSLMSLVGLFPPTSDINVVAGWAILVFFIITYYKMKCGPVNYLKGFTKPVALLLPINIISEFATPVSMAFRHYGNILSGTVISVLLGAALRTLSAKLLGWLPGFLGDIPYLQVGIPAVLSLYFDVFSSLLQAYIFAMLTMMYVSSAFEYDLYQQRQLDKQKKKQKKAAAKA